MPGANKTIIGLDYGTTFSGIASTVTRTGAVTSHQDVKVFDKWSTAGHEKIASRITYSESHSSARFGEDVGEVDGRYVFQWTKLQLTSKDPIKELKILHGLVAGLGMIEKFIEGERNQTNLPEFPSYLSRSPEDVIRDYLIEMSRKLYSKLDGRIALKEAKVDLVLSHPVDWPYEALNQIYRAAKAAFPKAMYEKLNNVYMTTESEAASVWTIADLVHQLDNPLIKGDCILLCDAGGGTVDIASFLVESVKPLKLQRVGELRGETCGATFIDLAFVDLCSKKLGRNDLIETGSDVGGHLIFTKLGRELLQTFEKHKRTFSGVESADIDIPEYLNDEPGIPASGMLTISPSEMQSLFKKTVDETLSMIRREVTLIRGTKNNDGVPLYVSVIGVVGGLSLNPYFLSRVKKWGSDNGRIATKQPSHPWTAVVRGSVLVGAGIGTPRPPPVGEALRFYGISVTKVHQDWKDGNQSGLVVNRFSGQNTIPDPIHWLVKRGDVILPNADLVRKFEIEINFTKSMQREDSEVQVVFIAALPARPGTLLHQISDGPPARLSELRELEKSCEIKPINIPLTRFSTSELKSQKAARGGSKFFTVPATVIITVNKTVRVDIMHGEKQIGEYSTVL